ncbi:hypothetical protein SNEBB_005716 [Seison nebaliae]|nr:hypothetical protein SNEBB_005716 [Seison nebaliae]
MTTLQNDIPPDVMNLMEDDVVDVEIVKEDSADEYELEEIDEFEMSEEEENCGSTSENDETILHRPNAYWEFLTNFIQFRRLMRVSGLVKRWKNDLNENELVFIQYLLSDQTNSLGRWEKDLYRFENYLILIFVLMTYLVCGLSYSLIIICLFSYWKWNETEEKTIRKKDDLFHSIHRYIHRQKMFDQIIRRNQSINLLNKGRHVVESSLEKLVIKKRRKMLANVIDQLKRLIPIFLSFIKRTERFKSEIAVLRKINKIIYRVDLSLDILQPISVFKWLRNLIKEILEEELKLIFLQMIDESISSTILYSNCLIHNYNELVNCLTNEFENEIDSIDDHINLNEHDKSMPEKEVMEEDSVSSLQKILKTLVFDLFHDIDHRLDNDNNRLIQLESLQRKIQLSLTATIAKMISDEKKKIICPNTSINEGKMEEMNVNDGEMEGHYISHDDEMSETETRILKHRPEKRQVSSTRTNYYPNCHIRTKAAQLMMERNDEKHPSNVQVEEGDGGIKLKLDKFVLKELTEKIDKQKEIWKDIDSDDCSSSGFLQLSSILFPHFLAIYQLTVSETIIIFTFSISSSNICGPVAAYFSFYFGYRIAFLFGSILCSFSLICNFFQQNYYLLLVTFFIFGVGNAIISSVTACLIGTIFDRYRALGYAVAGTGDGIGSFILPPLTNYFIHEYHLPSFFLIYGGLLMNLVVISLLVPRTHSIEPNENRKVVSNETNHEKSVQHFLPTINTSKLSLEFLIETNRRELKELKNRPAMLTYRQPIRRINNRNYRLTDQRVRSIHSLTVSMCERRSTPSTLPVHSSLYDIDQTIQEENVDDQENFMKTHNNDDDDDDDDENLSEKLVCINEENMEMIREERIEQNPVEDLLRWRKKNNIGLNLQLMKSLCQNHLFQILLIGRCFAFFSNSAPEQTILHFGREHFDLTDEIGVYFIMIGGIIELICKIILGILYEMKLFKKHNFLFFSLQLFLTALLLLAVERFVHNQIELLVFLVLYKVLCCSWKLSSNVLLSEIIEKDLLIFAIGFAMCIGGISSGIGNPIFGYLHDKTKSYQFSFWFVSGTMFFASVSALVGVIIRRM